MAAMPKEIFVYENWSSNIPSKIGTLYVDYAKGKETFSFEYQKEWIKDNAGLIIYPDISMYFGRRFVPYGDTLSLNIDENDNTISLDSVIATAKYYQLSDKEAKEMLKDILSVVNKNWERLASLYGISRSEIEYMRLAFSISKEAIK